MGGFSKTGYLVKKKKKKSVFFFSKIDTMCKHFNKDPTVNPGDSQVPTIQTNQKALGARAVPSALVCSQFFLKDGCSLLQKVNLEKDTTYEQRRMWLKWQNMVQITWLPR